MQKKANPEEKRQHLRLDYSRLISFTQYDSDNQMGIPGGMAAIKDLSESGILLQTAEAFALGNMLDLDIAFEEDKIIRAQGEVVHTRKTEEGLYYAGIKFTKIDESDLVYLKSFVGE